MERKPIASFYWGVATWSVLQLLLFVPKTFAIPALLTARDPHAQINIRLFPTLTSPSPHYGLVGDRVEVLKTSVRNGGSRWHLVRFDASKASGWVREDYIILQPYIQNGIILGNANADKRRSIPPKHDAKGMILILEHAKKNPYVIVKRIPVDYLSDLPDGDYQILTHSSQGFDDDSYFISKTGSSVIGATMGGSYCFRGNINKNKIINSHAHHMALTTVHPDGSVTTAGWRDAMQDSKEHFQGIEITRPIKDELSKHLYNFYSDFYKARVGKIFLALQWLSENKKPSTCLSYYKWYDSRSLLIEATRPSSLPAPSTLQPRSADKDLAGRRFHSAGFWTEPSDRLRFRAGQGIHFEIRNANVFPVDITIREINFSGGDNQQTVTVLPFQKRDIVLSVFGEEPIDWNLQVHTYLGRTDLGFLVTWKLYSTWIPGD
jgi:hypothetical protein